MQQPWGWPNQGFYPQPNAYVPPPYPRSPNGYWQPPPWNADGYGPRAPPVADNRSHKYPNLNPLLAADTTLLHFNIKKKPRTEIMASTYFGNRLLPANAGQVTHMRLISKSFPWMIDIVSQTNITCEAVWDALYSALQEPIADSEWGLVLMNRKQREAVDKGYKKRLEDDPQADKRVKRIDFCGDATLFKGLERDEEFEKGRLMPGTQAVPDTWVVKLGG